MNQRIASRLLLTLGLLVAWPAVSWSQGAFDVDDFDLGGFGLDEQSDPVTVASQFMPATASRPAVLAVTAEIEPDWHVYSLTQPKGGPQATRLSLVESEQYRPIGDWRAMPEPNSRVDNVVWNGLTIEEHDDRVTWYVPIEIAAGVNLNSLTIRGKVSLQACKESCIPLKFDIAAKLGEGVDVGPIEVSPPTNVTSREPKPSPPSGGAEPVPPANAGVFRADGSVVTWYGWLENKAVPSGGRTHLYLRAEMPANWHINAYAANDSVLGNKPTLIALEPSDGATFYQPESQSKLVEKDSPIAGFGRLQYHEEAAVWVVPIDLLTEAQQGSATVGGWIGYQACEADESGLGSCELAKGIHFAATIKIGEATAKGPATVSFELAKYSQAAERASQTADQLSVAPRASDNLRIIEFNESSTGSSLGLMGMLGAALVGGLILNLMPCVLPVIGLKVMAFAKQGGESRGRVFLLNLVYVAGLLSVFLLLATLASLTQWNLATNDFEWGELNTQTWFKVGMTCLVFVMALSFLGVWEIPLPGFAGSSTAAGMASREGFGGAFFKGILTTILATPCSGPFLGPVFGYTIGQSIPITYLVFLFVGLGMALPYLLIGMFPALVQWIPKPGAWMETFKQLMAFVLLATVVYLLSTINPDYFIPTMALLVALWFACWLGGRQPFTAPLARRAVAWLAGLTAAAAIGFIGFADRPNTDLPWKDFTPAQVADAQRAGRIVLVDFTADWCLTCQWNLATAIDVPTVRDVVAANNVEVLKADWTDEDADIEQALERLRSRSIPLLAIYPADRPNEVLVLRDTVSETQVLQALAAAGAAEGNPQRGAVRQDSTPRTAANDSRSNAL